MLWSGCRPSPDDAWKQAQLSLRRGDLASALKVADADLQRYPSIDSEWHWRFRVLKAEILDRLGSHNEALQLLDQDPPALLAKSDVVVRRRYTQAIACAWLQRSADAHQFLLDAETAAKQGHPDLLGEVSLRSGAVNYLSGDWIAAGAAYHDALQRGRQHDDVYMQTAALGGLAAVATKEEHYDESTDWSEASLRLAKPLRLQSSLAFILGNMAWNYGKLGDYDSALTFYQQAGEASSQAGLISQQIYWLTGTADIYYKQRDYSGAERVLSQGLDLARNQGNKRTLTDYLNGLAEAELETGQIDTAEKYCDEATALEKNNPDPSQLLTSQLVRGRIQSEKHDFDQAAKLFLAVAGDPKADTSQKWEAEARLARVYADTGRTNEAETEFRRSVSVIEAARSSVERETLRLSFLSTAINFYDDYLDFLASQHRMNEALRLADLSRARTLAEGLGDTAAADATSRKQFEPERLAQRLHAALFFYWLGEKHSYLWVITPGKMTSLSLPPAGEIDPLVKSYREAVAKSKDVAQSEQAAGEKLYALLVAPAEKLIPPHSRVILLPDGSLDALNFETLIVPAPKPHFWIEDVTLTTASSLSLLASSANRMSPKHKNLLLVGDALKASDDFEPLPLAEDEMQAVQKYFPASDRTVLQGQQATPSAYLASHPEKYAYLHFVTHGIASRTRPLESAVILSKERGSDSYKLYARDIVTRHLNAELVTISACNGSGIRAYSGEGLVGLSWAFLRAGAHYVIGALWEVSNAPSTVEFMNAFYKELSQGRDPATALRDAKLSFLHSNDVYRKPFYWAPFHLYVGS